MSHTEIMLLDSAFRTLWYNGHETYPMSCALMCSNMWPKGRRFYRF